MISTQVIPINPRISLIKRPKHQIRPLWRGMLPNRNTANRGGEHQHENGLTK